MLRKEVLKMGFTQTSEGRVFFKNADNDDKPATTPLTKKPVDPPIASDNTQIQILLLLKALNAKLKTSKDDRHNIKKELATYKETIKKLEEKTTSQETNYIDLEQKVARKQGEVAKKTTRVEDSIKTTLTQLEQAKDLVKALEEKTGAYDASLETLKDAVQKQRQKDMDIIKRQEMLENAQKNQNEKMVSSVATYVALTKRVSESETLNEALDNKIEDTRSDYIKLDRKIDKAIEDRNRLLRKVERIEQAVLETRDALNAKAMVLLTDKGAIGGVNMPHIADDTFKTDPMAIGRRMQEESLMPWWRRPVRLQATSLALIMLVVLMLGWIMSATRIPSPLAITPIETPRVSLYEPIEPPPAIAQNDTPYEAPITPTGLMPQDNMSIPLVEFSTQIQEKTAEAAQPIQIHNGQDEIENMQVQTKAPVIEVLNDIDLNDNDAVIDAFDTNEDQLAAQLNRLEPSSIPAQKNETIAAAPAPAAPLNDVDYKMALRKRIAADPKLTDIAKKIEIKAFEGIPEAQHDMGAIYVAGHGQIKQNLERAVLWFTEAANNGVANAKYNLGVLYHQGMGIPTSVEKAMELYAQAADLGHPEAQYNLGIASIEGIGVPYNPRRAAAYFEAAADKGITEAAYNLGLIYENGLLGQTRPNEALSWYKAAADNGSAEAKQALEQLASSLGIGMGDVEVIIARVRAEQSQNGAQANLAAEKQLLSQIQTELMRRGLYPGPIDGMSGPMTENAIKTFQRAADLSMTGAPSQELLGYLRASYQ